MPTNLELSPNNLNSKQLLKYTLRLMIAALMQGTEDSTKAIQLEIRNYVIIHSNTLYLFLY